MANTEGHADSLLNKKMTTWKKRNIYSAQKGPEHRDEDIHPKAGSRKGIMGPKMDGIEVPVRMEDVSLLKLGCHRVSVCVHPEGGPLIPPTPEVPPLASTERGALTKGGASLVGGL